jgi:hypothetical protein
MKMILGLLFIFLSMSSCFASDNKSRKMLLPCELDINESPVLQDFRLGMEINRVGQNNIIQKSENNYETLFKVDFPDSTYFLDFYLVSEKKQLSLITALYKSLKFNNLDEFTAYLNKTLNLPDSWKKQTPEQIQIEKLVHQLDQKIAVLFARRDDFYQRHGKNCREAKEIEEKEIPKYQTIKASFEGKRQIGSRLDCNGFSIIAYIDNSIEQNIPAIHLFLSFKSANDKPAFQF